MNMHEASQQWANRPTDQRFWDLKEMNTYLTTVKVASYERTVPFNSLEVVTVGDSGLAVQGDKKVPSAFTHWSFGQLCNLTGAPAGYLRELPNSLAANCLNHGMQTAENRQCQLLGSAVKNGETVNTMRAITSERYGRIWNVDLVNRISPLLDKGWRVPPARPAMDDPRTRPATEADCLKHRMEGLGIKPGDMIAPAGLYASEKDMFCFFVNEDKQIRDNLFRGFFIENSEVGDRAFKITMFLYNSVCGNHIIWGAEDVFKIRIVHMGSAENRAFGRIRFDLNRYTDQSATLEESRVQKAIEFKIAATPEAALDLMFKRNIASKKVLENGLAMAEEHEEDHLSDPLSAWGVANGLTRYSQTMKHTDARTEIDKAAGKVLELAF